MRTYFIEIYNAKDEVFRSYHIIADSKKAAITRVLNDQMGAYRTPRYQLEVVEARAD